MARINIGKCGENINKPKPTLLELWVINNSIYKLVFGTTLYLLNLGPPQTNKNNMLWKMDG